MYRITFDTKTAKWQVQLQTWYLFWRTIKTNPIGFENYDLAAAYVEQVGLARVYRNWRNTAAASIWDGAQPYGVPAVIQSPRPA